MDTLLSDSTDMGHTWSPWRILPCPDELGPPSLTNPILKLPGGRLAISIETNKTYEDSSRWFQRVVYLLSDDLGQSWSDPHTVSQDPTGRIFNWDQRAAVDPHGRLFSFTWTFDQETAKYLDPLDRFGPHPLVTHVIDVLDEYEVSSRSIQIS